jgi:hypothetical protein
MSSRLPEIGLIIAAISAAFLYVAFRSGLADPSTYSLAELGLALVFVLATGLLAIARSLRQ